MGARRPGENIAGAAPAARGEKTLSFEDETGRRRSKSEPSQESDTPIPSKPRRKRSGSPEVGHALRAAYQQAVNEDIPPEMLDLLGKLG
jgi:hypothetical protein